jgi:ABC-type multidrug transport system fused ATPase/permease subunit
MCGYFPSKYDHKSNLVENIRAFGLQSVNAIAHRLGTIRNTDRIYVLENGRIAQEGSFTQLS